MFYFSNILAGFLSSTKNAQKDFNWNCYITVLTIKWYKHINIFIFLFFSSGHTEFFSCKKTKCLQLLLSSFLAFKGRMVPMPIPPWHSFSDGNQELWQLNGQNSEMSCPSCLHFVQPVQCKMQWNSLVPGSFGCWALATRFCISSPAVPHHLLPAPIKIPAFNCSPLPTAGTWFILAQAIIHLSKLGFSCSSLLEEAKERVAMLPLGRAVGCPTATHCMHPDSHGPATAPQKSTHR